MRFSFIFFLAFCLLLCLSTNIQANQSSLLQNPQSISLDSSLIVKLQKQLEVLIKLEKTQSFKKRGQVNFKIGQYLYRLGHYQKAIHFYNEALVNIKQTRLPVNLAYIYDCLGLSYLQIKKDLEAENAFNYALKLFAKFKKNRQLGNVLINQGLLCQKKKRYSKSISKYLIAKDILKKSSNKFDVARVLVFIGKVYVLQKEYKQAKKVLQQSLNTYLQIKDTLSFHENQAIIASCYLQEKKYLQAIKWAQLSFSGAKNTGQKYLQKENLKILSEAFFQQRDFANAFFYQKQHLQIVQELNKIKSASHTNVSILLEQLFGKKLVSIQGEFTIYRQRSKWLLVLAFSMGLLIFYVLKNKIIQKRQLYIKEIDQQYQNKIENLSQIVLFKNQQLTTYVIQEIEVKQMHRELTHKFNQFLLCKNIREGKQKIRSMEKSIKTNLDTNDDWQVLEQAFIQVFPDFITKLKSQHPAINQDQIKLCILIKLELLPDKIARILGISPNSLRMKFYRLENTLNLKQRIKEYVTHL
ncbi:MAG TPA: hypothetical protein DCS93_13270 [Microscillaceae bacterium]|nr:hypothetical protein [Microscillaceae bacterium]